MSMKVCKECGTELSSKAKTCPKCGLDQRSFYSKHKILMIIFAIVCIGAIGTALSGEDRDNIRNTVSTGTSIMQKQEKMTLEKFNKIKTGMTYEEVVTITGEEGTLSTESAYGTQSMKIYYWYSSNGISNATVSFMNGKVTAKSQIGLD